MKKILFAAYSLDIGGIETALVTLINELAKTNKYEITLVLEKKKGIFLGEVNKNVHIIEYSPSNNKVKFIAKISNAINRLKFILKYKNKFDCAISYATYSLPSSFVSRTASSNSILWVHNNYLKFFKDDENKYIEFFTNLNVNKFTKIVFVSNESKKDFESRFTNIKGKILVCNNLINYKKINQNAQEEVDDFIHKKFTFLNVGRHDEEQKKLTRLIESSKILKGKGYEFDIVFIGSGKNTKDYKDLVHKYNLEESITFLGAKKNPYPYFTKCDCVILTSEYEGYPVVYVEAMTLKKPIITTNVSDSLKDVNGKFGLVCQKDSVSIAAAMEEILRNGFLINEVFNPQKYNNQIINTVESMITNTWK